MLRAAKKIQNLEVDFNFFLRLLKLWLWLHQYFDLARINRNATSSSHFSK